MVQDTPSRKLDQYILRFPPGLRDRIKQAAADNGRSLNAELVQRLLGSFEYEEDQLRSKKYLDWLDSGGSGEEPEYPHAASAGRLPDEVIERLAEQYDLQELSKKVDAVSDMLKNVTNMLSSMSEVGKHR